VTPLCACLHANAAPRDSDRTFRGTVHGGSPLKDAIECLGTLLAKPEPDVNRGCEDSLEAPLKVLACTDRSDRNMLDEPLKAERIDVNVQNADGDTVAMMPAANGHGWLIERPTLIPGFDANVKNARGETPERKPERKPEPPLGWLTPSPGPSARPSKHGQAHSGWGNVSAKSPGFH
jgi:hypothetical protein